MPVDPLQRHGGSNPIQTTTGGLPGRLTQHNLSCRVVGSPQTVSTRGVFLPPLGRKLVTPPQKGILHYEGVDHCSTKGGKKTPLVSTTPNLRAVEREMQPVSKSISSPLFLGNGRRLIPCHWHFRVSGMQQAKKERTSRLGSYHLMTHLSTRLGTGPIAKYPRSVHMSREHPSFPLWVSWPKIGNGDSPHCIP